MAKKRRIAIVSLGGNALLSPNKKPSIKMQMSNLRKSLLIVPTLIRQGYAVVITHGNGPQVGNILLRSEAGKKLAYTLPLDVCVGQSQGEIGYLIQKTLHNILHTKTKEITPILTQVLVDGNDPAFKRPTKPVGPFYEKKQKGMKKFSQGWRRVVPSPKPKKVVEANAIRTLIDHGAIVVCCGGGGIPVVDRRGYYRGVEGVIDKDLATVCLAKAINAQLLLIVTGPRGVFINYKRPGQQFLLKTTSKDMKKYYEEGHFGEGTMRPKIEASLSFLKQGGKRVIICSVANAAEALKGGAGTTIVP